MRDGALVQADAAGDGLVFHRITTASEMAEDYPKTDVEVVEGEIME